MSQIKDQLERIYHNKTKVFEVYEDAIKNMNSIVLLLDDGLNALQEINADEEAIKKQLDFISQNEKILHSEIREAISTLNVKLLDIKKQNSNIVQVISNIHDLETNYAESFQKIHA